MNKTTYNTLFLRGIHQNIAPEKIYYLVVGDYMPENSINLICSLQNLGLSDRNIDYFRLYLKHYNR